MLAKHAVHYFRHILSFAAPCFVLFGLLLKILRSYSTRMIEFIVSKLLGWEVPVQKGCKERRYGFIPVGLIEDFPQIIMHS